MKQVTLTGARIHITGTVQGVGFRPFVYGLATRLGLKGWVRNTSAGVDIQVEGTPEALDEFSRSLSTNFPPLARLDSFHIEPVTPNGHTSFEIIHSEPIPGGFIPLSPDVSICEDCLREMFDPGDRRYLYPFINCTNCGPRFTIIQDIPYDRPNTTMSAFEMCPDCQREYQDPLDRRFHAQPVACPACGPYIWMEAAGSEVPEQPLPGDHPPAGHGPNGFQVILRARQALQEGSIVAVKGLGGFHLACDATNDTAVAALRQRKLRVDKPFAIMMPDLETVARHCYLSQKESEYLQSRRRPVVLLWRKPESGISLAVAPNQNTLGVMLPYTPLHYLLFNRPQTSGKQANPGHNPPLTALVMTSGNLSEEPIAYTNKDARERLASLADFFLLHNRDIHVRCDDSVIRQNTVKDEGTEGADPVNPGIIFLRRSRGYAPDPIRLPWKSPQVLATGAELKNTFCLTKNDYAFVSHHIGDMENYETLLSFEKGIAHFKSLFRIQPEAIACDLHPDYLATRYGLNQAQGDHLPVFQVQHHHAHIAACLADNGLRGDHPVIGVALDGSGYGEDGNIWGGEFLIATYQGYRRVAHLAYTPLPGGDAGTKKPYRFALAYLWKHGIDWEDGLPLVAAACGDDLAMLRSMLANQINTPLTSSMGRLFDAVSALVGVRSQINYEAQAAIELEALVDPQEEGAYPLDILDTDRHADPQASPFIIETKSLFMAIIADLQAEIPLPTISAKFHNGLKNMIVDACQKIRNTYDLHEVALSGGVWQNMVLLTKTVPALRQAGFVTYVHNKVPANDGGLSLGQAAIAAQIYQSGNQ